MSKITVIGDIILDKYITGNTERKNPESPMPLLDVEKEEYRLGGAANVAANIASMDGKPSLIGLLGNDYHGNKFQELCKQQEINLNTVFYEFPTITKQRFIESTYGQQLLRVDYEKKFTMTKAYNDQAFAILQDLDSEYIVISDYNKGLINKALINQIKTYAKKKNITVLADTKPDNVDYFKGIYLLKPNFKEFCKMIGKEIENTDNEIGKHGRSFVKKYKLNVVITRGEKGAALITQDGEYYALPAQVKQVFDVTGAGDTFLATLAYALSQGYNLEEAVKLGNKASGIVVGKRGTATVTREEIEI